MDRLMRVGCLVEGLVNLVGCCCAKPILNLAGRHQPPRKVRRTKFVDQSIEVIR